MGWQRLRYDWAALTSLHYDQSWFSNIQKTLCQLAQNICFKKEGITEYWVEFPPCTDGKIIWEALCICITDSLFCTAETNTALQISIYQIKTEKKCRKALYSRSASTVVHWGSKPQEPFWALCQNLWSSCFSSAHEPIIKALSLSFRRKYF